MKRRSGFALAALLALAGPALAAFHTFRIQEVYSNADGTIQYVVLHEASNLGGQNLFAGHELSSRKGALRKSIDFGSNLPSANTAGRNVLIATPGFAALGIVTPDYVMPARFLFTDGGQVEFAGVDQVAFGPLPSDGVTALTRNGQPTPNAPRNFAGQGGIVPPLPVGNVEYHNAGLDHYFNSALAPDIDALDTGRIAGWARTGQSFKVHASAAAGGPGTTPVCRIYIPPPADSHFFSASPAECAETLAKFPFMVKETDAAYFVALPVTAGPAAGTCPPGTIAVYRVFNNRPDGNHRLTTDRATRDQMVARGGTAEGYGNDAVIMCAPQ